MFAAYNQWANQRVYEAASALDEDERQQDVGLFFGSLHRTLNHLLVGDRIWMQRITGRGVAPSALDELLFETFDGLKAARAVEDQRIVDHVESYDDEDFDRPLHYRNVAGDAFEQPLSEVLAHVFNHQTHHRGHAHAALTQLTGKAPPLDLIYFLRR